MSLLQGLFDMGWVLKAAVDISKKKFDKGECCAPSQVSSFEQNQTVYSSGSASGTDTVQSRVILLILLETLEQHGFSLYASIDQDNGPGGDSPSSEVDTWFCNRQADWTPGAPIYHA
jgi:hypothetical protein